MFEEIHCKEGVMLGRSAGVRGGGNRIGLSMAESEKLGRIEERENRVNLSIHQDVSKI